MNGDTTMTCLLPGVHPVAAVNDTLDLIEQELRTAYLNAIDKLNWLLSEEAADTRIPHQMLSRLHGDIADIDYRAANRQKRRETAR